MLKNKAVRGPLLSHHTLHTPWLDVVSSGSHPLQMRVRGTNPSRDTLTVDREVKEGWDVGGTCCGQGGGEGTIIYMSEMSRRPIAESFHPLSIPSHDQHLRSVFLPLRFQTPINPLRTVLSPELYGVRREPPFFLWIHPSCASSSLSQPRTQHAIHRRTHHPPLLHSCRN